MGINVKHGEDVPVNKLYLTFSQRLPDSHGATEEAELKQKLG